MKNKLYLRSLAFGLFITSSLVGLHFYPFHTIAITTAGMIVRLGFDYVRGRRRNEPGNS